MKLKYTYSLIIALSITVLTYCFYTKPLTNHKPCIALLTDFGYDFAVGSIKGVITSNLPNVTIIDLDHTIEKFNTISGGFVLGKSYKYFPKDTVFVCVIDPGVGTAREPICIATPRYTFIGPNNGLFDFVLEQEHDFIAYQMDELYLTPGANTFHGRDLFAPAAVDFCKGNLEKFKSFDKNKLVHITRSHDTIATYVDSFGNIKTNYVVDNATALGSRFVLHHGHTNDTIPFVRTFKDVAIG